MTPSEHIIKILNEHGPLRRSEIITLLSGQVNENTVGTTLGRLWRRGVLYREVSKDEKNRDSCIYQLRG